MGQNYLRQKEGTRFVTLGRGSTVSGSAVDGIHRYYITGRSCLTPGANDDVLLRLCTPTLNDACGSDAETVICVSGI